MSNIRKVAIVTGASRGMGKQMALRLARNGINVVIAARTMEQRQSQWPGSLQETEAEIKALGVDAIAVKCDLSHRDDVENLCSVALARYGRVDYLVNNARWVGPHDFAPFLEIDFETWEKNIYANLLAPVLASKLVLPAMIRNGCGIIVCTTSSIATQDVPGMPGGRGGVGAPAPTTKAGLNRFVIALAKETREYNIPVIALDPGPTRTERVSLQTASYGIDTSGFHSMDVPAAALEYLCCKCPHPMQYTGWVVVAEELVKGLNLR